MDDTNKYRLIGAAVMLVFTLVLLPLVFQRPHAPSVLHSRAGDRIPDKIQTQDFKTSSVAKVDLQAPTHKVEQRTLSPVKVISTGMDKTPAAVTHEKLELPDNDDVVAEFSGDNPSFDPLSESSKTIEKQPVLTAEKSAPIAKSRPMPVPVKTVATKPTVAKPKADHPAISSRSLKTATSPRVTPRASATRPNRPIAVTPTGWVVQVASLSDGQHASRLVALLKSKGFPAFTQVTKSPRGTVLTRVLIGPDKARGNADQRLKSLPIKTNLKGIVVPYHQ